MEETDNAFWRMMSGEVRRILKYNMDALEYPGCRTLDDMHTVLMRGLLQTVNIGFVNMPGVLSPKWRKDIKRRFQRQILPSKGALTSMGRSMHNNPEDDYIYIEIDGTTFSGLSTRTTFGNTLRSIMYMFFYIE